MGIEKNLSTFSLASCKYLLCLINRFSTAVNFFASIHLSMAHLAVSLNWECKTRKEPCWGWREGNWLMAEHSRCLAPQVSVVRRGETDLSFFLTHIQGSHHMADKISKTTCVDTKPAA